MAKGQRDILSYLSTDNSKCVDNNNEDEDVNVSSISDSSHDDCVVLYSPMDAQPASSSSALGRLNAEKPKRPLFASYPTTKLGDGSS